MKRNRFTLASLFVAIIALGLAPSIASSAAAQTTSQANIDQLQRDISTCRTGLNALVANIYRYPEKPDVAPGGKRAWKDVYGEFKTTQLASCYNVGSFIDQRSGQPIVKAVETGIQADGVGSYKEYFTGYVGVVAHGDRILGYCPGLHRSQYDCVSASQRIAEISTPRILDKLDRLSALECVPETGWAGCRRVDGLAGVDFKIFSSANVSVSAQRLVKSVYKDIVSRLRPEYPASKMNGFKVYITNGEDSSQLSGLYPVGSTSNADELRGGANGDFTWVSEQMICKTGVKTRNDAFAAGKRSGPDNGARTLDQVVHEFAHSLDFRYGLQAKYEKGIFPGASGFPAHEDWAWGVQYFFGVPSGTLNDTKLQFLNGLFTGRTSFGCADYKP